MTTDHHTDIAGRGGQAAAAYGSSLGRVVGTWEPAGHEPATTPSQITEVAGQVREPTFVLAGPRLPGFAVATGGEFTAAASSASGYQVMAVLPALFPEWLGDRTFTERCGVRFPYVTGEMANGIAGVPLVVAAARARLLGFFGAAGLSLSQVEQGVHDLSAALGDAYSWGVNLIHTPGEAGLEDATADLLLRRRVSRICASAFMGLTPAIVRCSATGLRTDHRGGVQRRTHMFAKVSHPDVAEQFMAPAPAALLRVLVAQGHLTRDEAVLAAHVPVAEDVTVEADSGGHTDGRPLPALLPTMLTLRDRLNARHGYAQPVRVGVAGGLGTPAGLACAFALGAAYVVTGSVNESCVEASLSDDAKALLAEAGVADVAMAPAADMFELGVKVQVLARGTMFAPRASRLYEAYRAHPSLEAIDASQRDRLEREVLHTGFDEIWSDTRSYWERRDPSQITRAEVDPRHRMALVFRWYLGMSSRWAIAGTRERKTDYQIWCGPAMGAFNQWVAGSFLEGTADRTVAQIAMNLLEGAACVTRAQQLRSYGVPVPDAAFRFRPRPLT